MDELDKMIAELQYKFLKEMSAEGGTWEEFVAYAFAAKDRDANLQAAAQLACADEEAAKHREYRIRFPIAHQIQNEPPLLISMSMVAT